MEGYATMLHDVEKEREEDLLDWVTCASDIDGSAMEDEQDGEWKTTRNSWKRKEKPVEESEIQEGGKKKMHTSADGVEGSEKEKPYDNLCPLIVNKNLSFDRADASTSAQSNSLKEKGEKGRVLKPNLGFNKTKTMRSEDSKWRYKRRVISSQVRLCRNSISFTHIYVGFTRYAVFPFNAPPRCCYRCQQLGHVAVNCNSPFCCLVCSGPHTKDECTAEPGEEKYANCHQTHIASSKKMSSYQKCCSYTEAAAFWSGF
ncbi:Zinc finger CCHC-type [Trinorchestia longiramus]|nr:Zinc finger CCHC-type [Trinorchestia longiramus]